MNPSPRKRRKLESDVKRIALHESGHAVANHNLRYGNEVLAVEKARWKHGGQLQGWCCPSLKWKQIDTSSLWRRLDEMTCIVAGYAAYIVCGLFGVYSVEDQCAMQVMFRPRKASLSILPTVETV